jgi:signal peptidase I
VIDEQPTRRGAFWREILILVGVAAVVAILVRAFLLQTFWIPSGSMESTLEINDRVLANKIVYQLREPARGEIVVFRAPPQWRAAPGGEAYIKRIIAVGGDSIECCDQEGRLIVNGHPLDEPYLFDANGTPEAASTEFVAMVPEGRLWMMGDHRNWSGDSVDHYLASDGDVMVATISEDDVIGRAFVRFWPVGRAGSLSVPEEFDAVPDR